MRTYVTFGQLHTHSVNGKTFDKDCVAVINSSSPQEGRELAFLFFGAGFCMEYPEQYWGDSTIKFFPRGYIEVN